MATSRTTTRALAWLLTILAIAALPPHPAAAQDGSAAPPAAAESDTPRVPREYRSPRATMRTFLEAMYLRGDAGEAGETLDTSLIELPDSKQLARRLYQILGKIELVDVDTLPSAATVNEQGLEQFIYFPQISDPDHRRVVEQLGEPVEGRVVLTEQADGTWKFSAATVASIDDLWEQMQSLDVIAGREVATISDWFEQRFPGTWLNERVLTVFYWQWVGLFTLILLGLIGDLVARLILRVISLKVIRQQDATAETDTIKRGMRPLGMVVAGVIWLVLLPVLELPDLPETILLAATNVYITLAGIWAAWRVTDLVAEVLASKAEGTETKVDDILIPMIRKALKIFIVIFGAIYAASSLHIDVLPLLTGLGIGSLAFAFAAKDTIENLFGSVAVLLDRPFVVGDWVVINDVEGTVEEIGFRSTRVRTFYNSLVTVPNATLVRTSVDNYGMRKYRRWRTIIGVQYDTTPQQLLAFTEGIRELVKHHPYTRKDYYQVWCNEFGPSSLNILVYVFHEVPDWSTELRERERLFIDIIRLADRLGVQFAFPTQTIHLFNEQHQPYEMQHPPPDSDADPSAMEKGVLEAHEIIRGQTWRSEKPGPVTYGDGRPLDQGPQANEEGKLDATEQRSAGSAGDGE